MAFYIPRNISQSDQILFDANGNAVGFQAAGSSSLPVLGMTPAKAAAVEALVSKAWKVLGEPGSATAADITGYLAALSAAGGGSVLFPPSTAPWVPPHTVLSSASKSPVNRTGFIWPGTV